MRVSTRIVLEKARKLISRAWIQHAFQHNGAVCEIGALQRAHFELVRDGANSVATSRAVQRARAALFNALPGYWKRNGGQRSGIIGFNDSGGRTKKEVLAHYRKAIRAITVHRKVKIKTKEKVKVPEYAQ